MQTASATATLPDGLSVTAGGLFTLSSSENADGKAKADGSATDAGTLGVGAAVAVNLVNVTNSATIGVGSSRRRSVGVTLSALETVNGADSTSTFDTETTSGAAAGTIGVAGSVSVGIITINTTASIGDGATVNAGGGDVSLSAASAAASTNKAQPKLDGATGKTVGVGASVVADDPERHDDGLGRRQRDADQREQPDALRDDDRRRHRLREERRGRRRRAHRRRGDHALERHDLGDDRRSARPR